MKNLSSVSGLAENSNSCALGFSLASTSRCRENHRHESVRPALFTVFSYLLLLQLVFVLMASFLDQKMALTSAALYG